MRTSAVHECGCVRCRENGDGSTKELHAELNRFLSTLDEKLRAEFLGMESMTARCGDRELEEITGVKAAAIARARWELHRRQLLGPAYDMGRAKSFSCRTTMTYYAPSKKGK